MRLSRTRTLGLVAALAIAAAASIVACGDSGTGTGGSVATSTGSGGTQATTGGAPTTTTSISSAQTASSSVASSGTGGAAPACTTTAPGTGLRGSAIAITSDDKTIVSVNRDAGTVSILSVDYASGQPAMTLVKELTVGNEPWQVVIDACDTTAYVVLRKDQKVVEIKDLTTAPAIGGSVSVGSEPTSLTLTPNNTALYVSNWVDGTLSNIDPVSMTVTSTIDLNATIAGTGDLGPQVMTAPRASLAHPRGIAVTNNGDANDTDETLYVSEFFAVRTAPENAANFAASDTNWKGLLYKVPVMTGTATIIDLPPVANTSFNDANGNPTGCFPKGLRIIKSIYQRS